MVEIDVGTGEPLLRVRGLTVDFVGERTVRAVRGLDYDIYAGEALGLVGESGSGKSVSALALLGLLPKRSARVAADSAAFDGIELIDAPHGALRDIRGERIAMIFQDPLSSLNPVLTIERQITEVLEAHTTLDRRAVQRRALDLLDLVEISQARRRLDDYPHQFSGGMRQRVMLAMALACSPDLLIADEPTTALDVTIQAQIMDLFTRLRAELGMAVLLISHDLGAVAGFTDRVAVMYAGRIVESGATEDVLAHPRHPYTAGLLASVPRIDQPRLERLRAIDGSPPDLSSSIVGCSFAPRCGLRSAACVTTEPTLATEPLAIGRAPHGVACHHPLARVGPMEVVS